jgi:hypothetical protein
VPQSFQPFRHVLPLVPFLCVAAAAAALDSGRRLASRIPAPRAVAESGVAAAVVALLCALLILGGVMPYYDEHFDRVDTRVAARRWLEDRIEPGDDVLVEEELVFLPSELDRLGGGVLVKPSADVLTPTAARGYDYVVTGIPDGNLEPRWSRALQGRPIVADFGHRPTPVGGFWRGNDQGILVYGLPSAENESSDDATDA